MLRNQKGKYEWCFSRVRSNKRGAANAIPSQTAKNRRKNVLRSKKQKNKVLFNIFRGFEVTRKGTIDVVTAKREHEK